MTAIDLPRPVRMALPNKGRLQAPSATLLSDAGLVYEKTANALSARVRNVPIELLFVRAEDVAELVSDRVADIGITGLDLVAENQRPLEVLCELGYGRCRLVAAVPASSPVEGIAEFAGLRVATAHPRVTEAFFDDKGITVTTVPLHGSVEVAPKLDVADAIVDLVSTGSTMLVNGLRPVSTLLESQAVLVAGAAADGRLRSQIDQVAMMLTAAVAGRGKRYVLMNAPSEALETIEGIIPGLDSPSVVPLAHEGMLAIHSVVDADEVWGILPELKSAGASGILVLPIEKLLP